MSLINASLTCREARHAPTKALPLLVPKCLRKLSVLAILFRIHKLKPDFAIFGRPYCISNCSSTHTETLVLPFLGVLGLILWGISSAGDFPSPVFSRYELFASPFNARVENGKYGTSGTSTTVSTLERREARWPSQE